MSDCKVKLSVDICGESALDTVTKLVVGGMSVNKACKQVAEDFNKTNDGATVKANTLRQSYKRAQKVGTCTNSADEKLVHVPTKKLVPLDLPMVANGTIIDTTKYITIEEHNKIVDEIVNLSMKDSEELMLKISKLETLLIQKESALPSDEILIKSISREKVYNFIKKIGNQFQCLALKKDGLSNEDLLKIFFVVRETYKNTTPPPSWDKEIIEAEKITN